jgi:hypothetical protein
MSHFQPAGASLMNIEKNGNPKNQYSPVTLKECSSGKNAQKIDITAANKYSYEDFSYILLILLCK